METDKTTIIAIMSIMILGLAVLSLIEYFTIQQANSDLKEAYGYILGVDGELNGCFKFDWEKNKVAVCNIYLNTTEQQICMNDVKNGTLRRECKLRSLLKDICEPSATLSNNLIAFDSCNKTGTCNISKR